MNLDDGDCLQAVRMFEYSAIWYLIADSHLHRTKTDVSVSMTTSHHATRRRLINNCCHQRVQDRSEGAVHCYCCPIILRCVHMCEDEYTYRCTASVLLP